MLQNFINKYFEVGEMYLEVLQSPCVDTCEKCPKAKFIGLECHKIFKPIPGYSANGFHYLPASKEVSKTNDKERKIDDFQSRA